MSLLSRLRQVPAPRSRHRREYPLPGFLAILILAAAHGETSLRGIWIFLPDPAPAGPSLFFGTC